MERKVEYGLPVDVFAMNKLICGKLFVLLLAAASELSAQTGIRAPQGWSLGLMGGAAAFSDMQRGNIRVLRTTSAGMETRDLARRIGAKTSTAVGGYLSFWPNRNWGLRVHGTYTPTRFETVMRDSEADLAGSMAPDSARLAALNVATADLQVLFRLPTIKNRVMLYGIVGGGAARYQASGEDPVPPEAAEDFDSGNKIRPSGMFGLGAMLPFQNRAFRLHFELTDHITRTPIEAEIPRSGEQEVDVTSSVRFMVGASWSPKH